MRKITITLLMTFGTFWLVAQNQENLLQPVGKIGVGTTSPQFELDINGNLRIRSLIQEGLDPAELRYLLIDRDGVIRPGPIDGPGSDNPGGTKGTIDNRPDFDNLCFTGKNVSWKTDEAGITAICTEDKIGVGTYTPSHKFTVNGAIKSMTGGFVFPDGSVQTTAHTDQQLGFNDGILTLTNGGSATIFEGEDIALISAWTKTASNQLHYMEGNVGIGYSTPTEKLSVKGNVLLGSSSTVHNGYGTKLIFEGSVPSPDRMFIARYNVGSDLSEFRVNLGNDLSGDRFVIGSGASWNEHFTVRADGVTSIGTNTVVPNGYLLAVRGKVICEEVRVQLINGSGEWPDYVFSEDYDLPELNELESYVKKNKHLPGIPSESEVSENGVELGEMNKELLKKVEELTLYMIELKKENEAIKSKLSEMESKISE